MGLSWIAFVILAECSDGGGAADKIVGPPTLVSAHFTGLLALARAAHLS